MRPDLVLDDLTDNRNISFNAIILDAFKRCYVFPETSEKIRTLLFLSFFFHLLKLHVYEIWWERKERRSRRAQRSMRCSPKIKDADYVHVFNCIVVYFDDGCAWN